MKLNNEQEKSILSDIRRVIKSLDNPKYTFLANPDYDNGFLNGMFSMLVNIDLLSYRALEDGVTFAELLAKLETEWGWHWTKNGYDEEYYEKN